MSNSSQIGITNRLHSSHSEDEEESLSLSDFPLLSSSTRHQEDEEQPLLESSQGKSATEDFDFGSLSASLDVLESEMCVADEVFYCGQFLPFRHSVSSACTSAAIAPCNLARSVSRSESMDRIRRSGFRSSSTASSSRSSSTRSSSINSSTSAEKLSQRHSNYSKKSNHTMSSKFRIQLEPSRSPRPYVASGKGPRRSTSSAASPAKKSALWELFRLGLVQTPEIELEDLKARYGKHHGNGREISDAVICGNGNGSGRSVDRRISGDKSGSAKTKLGGMKFNCKCSVEAVEPVEKAGRGKQQEEHKKRKQAVTRHHRTFEWLWDLSHAVVLNDL